MTKFISILTKFIARTIKFIIASAFYAYAKRRLVWYYRILLSEDFSYIMTRYYKRHSVQRDVDRQYNRKQRSNDEKENHFSHS